MSNVYNLYLGPNNNNQMNTFTSPTIYPISDYFFTTQNTNYCPYNYWNHLIPQNQYYFVNSINHPFINLSQDQITQNQYYYQKDISSTPINQLNIKIQNQQNIHHQPSKLKVQQKIKLQQDQFSPVKPTKKAKIKENRNVYSNILRSFFRKINDRLQIKDIVQKIIEKKGFKIKLKQFVSYVRHLRIDHARYIKFKKLKQIFLNKNEKECTQLLRILLQQFIQNQLLLQTLTSKKIRRWSVVLHIKAIRQLKDRLYN